MQITVVRIIILISVFILSICIITDIQFDNKTRTLLEKERFENTPITTFDISTAPTPANKDTTCSNSSDMISVCMNYENCCSGSGTNQNSKCFCTHPFVHRCNDLYKTCIAGLGDTSKCDASLKGCCSKYSETDILSSNFLKPVNAVQSSNQICTLNGLSNLGQRCMELCQTNLACKAYSINLGECTLYDTVNNNTGKSTDNYIYVVKK